MQNMGSIVEGSKTIIEVRLNTKEAMFGVHVKVTNIPNTRITEHTAHSTLVNQLQMKRIDNIGVATFNEENSTLIS